ncbi:neutral zinc metallopeptidase [Micropruina sonneratiae]|uniref:neutral zinc metallopeptidase n=1 Tax=Micropruina sonneratiae TaxID=2986940 RepID=UPI002225DF6A|nr:neutral zinc metallopeptidase [Micropruina sp. KQZ13P-5]MCW3157555.1 neutral zinc metallopeptidase [Micropruina sp. KQZ13P-5]
MNQPWPPPQQPLSGGWNQGTGWGWPQSSSAGQRLAAGWQQQAVGGWQQQPGGPQPQFPSQQVGAQQSPTGWQQAPVGGPPSTGWQAPPPTRQPWGYPPPGQGFVGPYRSGPASGRGGGGCLRAAVISAALGVAVLVVLLALFGLFLSAVTGPSTASTSATARVPSPASSRTPTPTPRVSSTSPTARATATASGTAPTTPTTTSAAPIPGPSGVGKADKDPSALPEPTSWSRASTWTKNNALYGRSVKVPTRCGVGLIDPATISSSALKAHLNRLAGCLTMVWRPQVRAAGFTMPYPPVTVYTGDSTSPCGRMNAHNAFYCSGSQQIYFGTRLHEILPERDYAYDLIMAHEFGHAVQARTGIFTSAFAYYYSETGAERTRMMRRLELQADCFAGAGMNALSRYTGLTASDREGFVEIARAIADDTLTGKVLEHGSAKARARWLDRGLGSAALKVCNTFTASNATVR